MNRSVLVLSAVLLLLFALHLAAEEQVDFRRDVYPLLKSKCISCHGANEQEGQLRLDGPAVALQGGVSGRAIVAGSAKQSLLWKRVAGIGEGERMPLDEEPLSQKEQDLLRRWIDSGAKWPAGIGSDAKPEEVHWSYIPPVRSAPPGVKNSSWPRTAIDFFVLAEMERRGFSPSPAASRAKLLRRVHLDLIGIPPTLAEVEAFENDRSPRAYERVVDRLLSSPRYGERWARAWLDLARYADSNGYQADQYRNVWPYRDWVIQAMNDDMPFDRFTIEQLAGDLIQQASLSQKIATGFHRLTTCNVEAGVDPEQNRVNQVIDRVNATGTVWLGTSFECMQCHNHKYDPFTQREYYQVFAYFNNTPMEVEGNGVTYNFIGPKLELPYTDLQRQQRSALSTRIKSLQRQIAARRKQVLAGLATWEQQTLAETKDSAAWHLLAIQGFDSEGGATYRLLEDGSLLVNGPNPDKDIYTITASTGVQKITGFKLEALTHETLPGKGPGRGDAARPNFVLHELTVRAAPRDGSAEVVDVPLLEAKADFSQKRWPVAGAVDGKPNTGWAINPQFGKPHHASFLVSTPLGFAGGTTFTISLDQHQGGRRTIGRLRLWAMTGQRRDKGVPAAIVNLLKIPAGKRQAAQQQAIEDHFVSLDAALKKLQAESARVTKQREAIKPVTTLAMIEKAPRQTMIFRRGNFKDPSQLVTPGTPKILHPLDSELPKNRLGFARWLVDRRNPLVGRVTVNRWWTEFFGRGLVTTIEDFGTQGEPPSHPRLLDYLAVELMEKGWSMKSLHRQIVLSATYQQSSRSTPQLRKQDPGNRWLARGPRHRLSAEMIRDNALTVTGLLGTRMGGPPIYPPQPDGVWRHVGRNAPKYMTSTGENRYRRGVYVVWRRSAPYPSFTNFDAPDRASCVVKRPRTNTPLQALTLLNDPAYLEMASALAARIDQPQTGDTTAEKIAFAWRTVLARRPTAAEVATLAQAFEEELAHFRQDPAAARQILGAQTKQASDPATRAAWLYISNILLNLDETITKG